MIAIYAKCLLFCYIHIKNMSTGILSDKTSLTIGGPKMSGNFVRERQRIVYIYMYIIYVNNTLPLAHEISRHFWAAYALTDNKTN